jgi:hypothetical protein
MDRLNSHFLCPLELAPRVVSGDGQSALVDNLGVSPSRYCLLTGPYHLSSGDSTTGLGLQCWDGSLTPSQQPVYNLRVRQEVGWIPEPRRKQWCQKLMVNQAGEQENDASNDISYCSFKCGGGRMWNYACMKCIYKFSGRIPQNIPIFPILICLSEN